MGISSTSTMVRKVCSCCLKIKSKENYDSLNSAGSSTRRCLECAAAQRPIPCSKPQLPDGMDVGSISVDQAENLLGFKIPQFLTDYSIPNQEGNMCFSMPHAHRPHPDVLNHTRAGPLEREQCTKCGKKSRKKAR